MGIPRGRAVAVYSFLDRLFSRNSKIRLSPQSENKYRLDENGSSPFNSVSYVELTLANGFVVKHDENFRVKHIFSTEKGFCSKSDFIVVSQTNGKTEYFIVELKSRNYKIEKVRNQFICGVAMAEYCRRLGIDFEGDVSRFLKCDVYAVLLTNTVTEHRGTALDSNLDSLAFAKKCGPGTGVLCVNGHTVTLDQLRANAIPVKIGFGDFNPFNTLVPYPGGEDDKKRAKTNVQSLHP